MRHVSLSIACCNGGKKTKQMHHAVIHISRGGPRCCTIDLAWRVNIPSPNFFRTPYLKRQFQPSLVMDTSSP